MSLRARLLITTVALVAAGLLVVDLATYRATSSYLTARVDDQLEQVLHRPLPPDVFNERDGGSPLLPDGTYIAGVAPDGSVVWRALGYGAGTASPPALPESYPTSTGLQEPTEPFTMPSTDGDTRYRAVAVTDETGQGVVIAMPLTDVEATLDRIVRIELVVTVVVLVALALLALWLVRLGLRPLEGMGETAGAIAAGDLSRRVEPANERTEVGRLGLALNAMLAQIEQAFEERRRSEERLRRFVGDASHELRTPLTSIRGYAELFRRGADSRPEDLAKTMRRIEDEAARMGVLVDDLLLLARLDQRRPLERERVSLTRVASDAVDAARVVEPERAITLATEEPSDVAGEAARLRQVVDNLLDNARTHTPSGAPVDVVVGPGGDGEVLLVVRDTGPGLDEASRARVFERFYRGDPSRTRDTGGAGLGLSIVAAIVEAHGGRITAGAAEGGGASFEVRIPAWIPPTPSPPPPEAAPAQAVRGPSSPA